MISSLNDLVMAMKPPECDGRGQPLPAPRDAAAPLLAYLKTLLL